MTRAEAQAEAEAQARWAADPLSVPIEAVVSAVHSLADDLAACWSDTEIEGYGGRNRRNAEQELREALKAFAQAIKEQH